MTTVRKCQACKVGKDINQFPSNPAYRDGKGVTCLFCKKMEMVSHRERLDREKAIQKADAEIQEARRLADLRDRL